ncbi:unnamed protein product [Symbiodinium natans]|uniref:Uncharacterized protein n=1 Tax=Symbiodinium natans TaxID=878477 RepID=A0A812UNB0_9DINO|nr:unnamed protein product [Symbiodinium natans]
MQAGGTRAGHEGHHRRCRRETRLRKRREGADLSSQGCFGRPSTLFEEPGDKEVE